MKVLTVEGVFRILFFVLPKVDYVLITSLFVCGDMYNEMMSMSASENLRLRM